MRILHTLSRHRSDFTATLICEHCNSEQHLSTGYDDHFYHSHVLPSITCHSCKRNRYGNLDPKNPDGLTHVEAKLPTRNSEQT